MVGNMHSCTYFVIAVMAEMILDTDLVFGKSSFATLRRTGLENSSLYMLEAE